MAHDQSGRLIAQIDTLLDEERAALLKGDLESVTALVTRKEALIDRLNAQAPQPRNVVSPLREKVLRNQALLDGALEGIRNVASRMSALRRNRRNLETYDRTGRRSEISSVIEHKVEKRA